MDHLAGIEAGENEVRMPGDPGRAAASAQRQYELLAQGSEGPGMDPHVHDLGVAGKTSCAGHAGVDHGRLRPRARVLLGELAVADAQARSRVDLAIERAPVVFAPGSREVLRELAPRRRPLPDRGCDRDRDGARSDDEDYEAEAQLAEAALTATCERQSGRVRPAHPNPLVPIKSPPISCSRESATVVHAPGPMGRRGRSAPPAASSGARVATAPQTAVRVARRGPLPSAAMAAKDKTLVIAEKPSVGRDLARVLPGPFAKHEGYLEGPEHVITWAVGHLVQLAEPDEYDPKFKRWRMADLPIVPEHFKLVVRDERSRKQMSVVTAQLHRADISEVVNSCDAGREGELIFAYLFEKAGSTLPVRRLWLSSMTATAMREAFATLRPASELALLEQAARSRSEADWIVGMNATRAAAIRRRSSVDGAGAL